MLIKAVSKVIIASALLFSVNAYAEDEVYAIPDELHAVFKDNGFKDVELEESMIKGTSLIIIFSDFDIKRDRYLQTIRLVCSAVQKDNNLLNDYDIDDVIAQNLMESVQASFKDATKSCLSMPKDNNEKYIDDHTAMTRLK